MPQEQLRIELLDQQDETRMQCNQDILMPARRDRFETIETVDHLCATVIPWCATVVLWCATIETIIPWCATIDPFEIKDRSECNKKLNHQDQYVTRLDFDPNRMRLLADPKRPCDLCTRQLCLKQDLNHRFPLNRAASQFTQNYLSILLFVTVNTLPQRVPDPRHLVRFQKQVIRRHHKVCESTTQLDRDT